MVCFLQLGLIPSQSCANRWSQDRRVVGAALLNILSPEAKVPRLSSPNAPPSFGFTYVFLAFRSTHPRRRVCSCVPAPPSCFRVCGFSRHVSLLFFALFIPFVPPPLCFASPMSSLHLPQEAVREAILSGREFSDSEALRGLVPVEASASGGRQAAPPFSADKTLPQTPQSCFCPIPPSDPHFCPI